jgi:hypothetical protein
MQQAVMDESSPRVALAASELESGDMEVSKHPTRESRLVLRSWHQSQAQAQEGSPIHEPARQT